jgi:hypothetical protein
MPRSIGAPLEFFHDNQLAEDWESAVRLQVKPP